jgi:putative ABC transport system permease protein
MIRNYFKIAFRNLAKNKVYSLINIIGLAIGISSCLAIFLLVNFELSYENFWKKKDQIYHITSIFKAKEGINYNDGLSSPIAAAARAELPDFAKITAFQVFWTKVKIIGTNNVKKNFTEPNWPNSKPDIIITESSYFDLFPHHWLIGSPKTSLKEPFTVVLTETKMKKYFGNITPEMAIGKTVIYSDSMFTKVTGIVQVLPANTDLRANDFISFKTIESGSWRKTFQFDQWTNTNSGSQAFVELPKNANIPKLNKDLTRLVLSHLSKEDKLETTRGLTLQALSDMHFDTNYYGVLGRVVNMQTLYILMIIAAFLLIMATINFINLATVQSFERNKEIGVRKLLGGNRTSLIKQFLSETFLITLTAMLLAVLLLKPIFSLFSDFIPGELTYSFLQPNIFLFLAFITVFTALLSGLYPAFIASKLPPISTLKGAFLNGQTQNSFLRKLLIVFQFSIAQVFILGTVLMISQSRYLLQKDLGIKKENFIYFDLNWLLDQKRKPILVERLKVLNEIDKLSLSELAARNGYSTNDLKFKGKRVEVHQKSVDDQFIGLFGLKMIAGRALMKSDTTKELVVNEAFTKVFGYKSPQNAIGELVDWWDTNGKPMKIPIVGVMKDFHFQSLHHKINPMMIRTEPNYARNITFKLKNNQLSKDQLSAFSAKVNAIYKNVYPEIEEPIELKFFDENVANFYKNEQKMAKILNTATAIAILISCLGLFGLTAHAVQKRTKEIGIRKVLGASVASIMALLSKDFLKLVLISIVIASPIAYYFMNKWLTDFAYRVPISWSIFALAGIFALAIAFLTVSFQSIKAAMMNPVKSLKTE